MKEHRQYKICDDLDTQGQKHCAALVITKDWIEGPKGMPQLAQPSNALRNGTLTFIRSEGRVYGITCWHVITHYRDLNKKDPLLTYSMRTMVNGFKIVLDRFLRPVAEYLMPQPDIAIRELRDDFPAAIGKVPIDIDNSVPLPHDITFGYAIGFPEGLKRKTDESGCQFKVVMPHAMVLAETNGFPKSRFSLHSDLHSIQPFSNLSGMSGGPIFWSTEDVYGIMGIIYEDIGEAVGFGGNFIHLAGELATTDIIRDWIQQYRRHCFDCDEVVE